MNKHGVEYLVIGGWAAIAHGLPRTTQDVDLFIRPAESNVARLIKALSKIGFGIAADLQPEEILRRKVFLFADQIRIDIHTQPWKLKEFAACKSRRLEKRFDGIRIPFLGLEDLIRSKDTDREQDRRDVEALRKISRRPKNGP